MSAASDRSPLDDIGDGGMRIPKPPDGAIAISGASLTRNTTEAQTTLIAVGSEIYQHGNRLVRVGRADGRRGKMQRPVGAPVLYELTTPWLVDELTRQASFVKFDRRSNKWVQVNAPRNVAETILARAGAWPFPRLSGFIEAPILTLSGRIPNTAGYDCETELYQICREAIEQ